MAGLYLNENTASAGDIDNSIGELEHFKSPQVIGAAEVSGNASESSDREDAALEGRSQGAVTQATGFAYAARRQNTRGAATNVGNSLQERQQDLQVKKGEELLFVRPDYAN